MNANYRSIILTISLFFALSASISAAPGDLDPTFGIGGKLIDGAGHASDVAVQSDGKIVVVGSGPLADFVVARYNQDGSPDLTFGSGTGRVITDLGGQEYLWGVVIQPDGKIVAGGVSTLPGSFFFIARYNSDGSLDTGFGGGTGKVLTALCVDTGDGNYGADLAIQPDGKLVGAVGFDNCGQLIRYASDGSLDVSFGNHGFVTTSIGSYFDTVLVQPNGKIILGAVHRGMLRYEPNGSLDLSFGSGGFVSTFPFLLTSLTIQPDGKMIAFGRDYHHLNSFSLVRYNINGSLDTSFGLNGLVTTPIGAGNASLNSAAIQPDGKIVAAGSSIGINGTSDFTLVRYNGDGSLDGTFGGGDGITTVDFNNSGDSAGKVVLDSRGRAVVLGVSGNMFAIARFLLGDPTPPPTCANPIDCADFFIRQQYLDFLNREPEPEGLQFYLDLLNRCHPSDAECIRFIRGVVSANFFRSPEFQRKGNYVMYLYLVSIGQRPVTAAELHLKNDPALNDRPNYQEFMTDLASISTPNDDPVLTEQKKNDLANNWMTRPQIVSIYGSLSNAQFVQKLIDVSGVTPANQNWVADLNAGTRTRAQVLRLFAESPEVDAKFFKQSFVTMEYFGYLRRKPEDCHDPANWGGSDPSQCGFIFHNARFNLHPDPHVIQNIIVRGFIESPEYRRRFGSN